MTADDLFRETSRYRANRRARDFAAKNAKNAFSQEHPEPVPGKEL